jgi:hypothetical protein
MPSGGLPSPTANRVRHTPRPPLRSPFEELMSPLPGRLIAHMALAVMILLPLDDASRPRRTAHLRAAQVRSGRGSADTLPRFEESSRWAASRVPSRVSW